MNWNKILNMMLVIFLILNGGFFIYTRSQTQDQHVLSEERALQLNRILNQQGIAMYNFFPTFEPMVVYELRVPSYDKAAILFRIFDGRAYEPKRGVSEGRLIYESYHYEDEALTFFTGSYSGMITYHGMNRLYTPKTFDASGVEAVATSFAKDLTSDVVELTMTALEPDLESDAYEVLFNEVVDGRVMFCNYVTMTVTPDGVSHAIASIYPFSQKSDRVLELRPIDEVLYKWMPLIKSAEGDLARIRRIELGYQLGVDVLESGGAIEALPHYRIWMQDGRRIDINAYNNNQTIHNMSLD